MNYRTLLISLFTTIGALQLNAQDDVDHFSIKLGYNHIQHLEPQIIGESVSTNFNGTLGGNLIGFNAIPGMNLKFHYFFNNHLGIFADSEFGTVNHDIEYQNPSLPHYVLHTEATTFGQNLGLAGRFSQKDSPFNAYIGTSVGFYMYDYRAENLASGQGFRYTGNFQALKFGMEAMIDYELFKGFNLYTSLAYNTRLRPKSEGFDMAYTTDTGQYYEITQNSPSMASIRFSVGLGINF